LELMIEYTLIQTYWIEYVKWQQNLENVQEMSFNYSPSSICWKSKHGEQNGKEQLTK
jgi:hypothetical protein